MSEMTHARLDREMDAAIKADTDTLTDAEIVRELGTKIMGWEEGEYLGTPSFTLYTYGPFLKVIGGEDSPEDFYFLSDLGDAGKLLERLNALDIGEDTTKRICRMVCLAALEAVKDQT